MTSLAIVAGSLLGVAGGGTATAQTAPGAQDPAPQDLATTRPVDTAGIDPVLDAVDVEEWKKDPSVYVQENAGEVLYRLRA